MTFFDPSDVAQLRADALATMVDRATILRMDTADGGTALTPTPVLTNVRCGVRGGSPREVTGADGVTRRIIAIPLVFPYGTVIPQGAWFTVGSRTFKIIGPEGLPSAAHQAQVVVLTEEIT